MKRKEKANYHLLVLYFILKTAYQIGHFPLTVILLIFRLLHKALILVEKLIIFLAKFLIVFVYRLRYFFLITAAVYLGHFACNYYLAIPDPRQITDFRAGGKITIYDRNQIVLFDSQMTRKQLENKKIVKLNKKQLAEKLTDQVKTEQLDFLKKIIIAWRLQKNFSLPDLQKIYLSTSNYIYTYYRDLPIYKRSPLAADLVFRSLARQYGNNFYQKDLTITTSFDQNLQIKLQQAALEKNQTGLSVVYDAESKTIIAFVNQNSPTSLQNLENTLKEKQLIFFYSQKKLAQSYEYLSIN